MKLDPHSTPSHLELEGGEFYRCSLCHNVHQADTEELTSYLCPHSSKSPSIKGKPKLLDFVHETLLTDYLLSGETRLTLTDWLLQTKAHPPKEGVDSPPPIPKRKVARKGQPRAYRKGVSMPLREDQYRVLQLTAKEQGKSVYGVVKALVLALIEVEKKKQDLIDRLPPSDMPPLPPGAEPRGLIKDDDNDDDEDLLY